MEEKQRLYEIIKTLSEENLELYKKLKKYEEQEELIECDNCGEMVSEDDLCDNDFITEGGTLNICMQCVENGYGE